MVAEIDLKSIPATQSLTAFNLRVVTGLCKNFVHVSIWLLTVFDEISDLVTTAKYH